MGRDSLSPISGQFVKRAPSDKRRAQSQTISHQDPSPAMEKPQNSENVLVKEKYHSMLNMDVLPDSDTEVVVDGDDKKYEDPTQIFVKSRVTVCMLILSVVTLSVCLISVIFFVRLGEGVQTEEKIYVLGKLVFHFCLSETILNIAFVQFF